MRRKIYADSYHGYDLSYSPKNNEGFYVEMLDSIESYLDYIMGNYSRVFFTMLCVKYPAGYTSYCRNNNERFLKFLEALRIYYKRRECKPMYFWAREYSMATGQFHYHLVFIFDGREIQNGHGVKAKAIQLWGDALGIENGAGYVELCGAFENYQYGGVKVDHRDSYAPEIHRMFFAWMSYLAKVYSKGRAPGGVNEYGCSRIPKL